MAVDTAPARAKTNTGPSANGRAAAPGGPGAPRSAPVRTGAWKTSLALALALAVATGGLHVLFRTQGWWFVVVFVVAAVLGAAAATRELTRNRVLPPIAATAALIALVTALFTPGSVLLGIIATLDTYRELFAAANDSIYRQSIPAEADSPIVFVLCLGIGAIAVVCDLLAITFRRPALAGIPLVVVLAIPSVTAADITDPVVFVLAAAAYLYLLVAGRPRSQPGLAVGIGAAAIVGSLVLPVVLPSIDGSQPNASPGLSTGVNPVLGLGDDLRRASERKVLDYSTESGDAHYLRLVTLENFTGDEWAPTELEIDTDNGVEGFGPVPGLSNAVPRDTENTVIDIGNLSSRWLPMPYPPRAVSGLDDDWFWEPNGFSVSSPDDTSRGQDYAVESLFVQPTPEQLLAAGTTVSPELEPYLELPGDLPGVISETAATVVAAVPTNYEKALALQEYFRSGDFDYSEDAPVEGDYDGTGMEVIATFLDVRSGYCVHFSSAMAVMARSLDIPARVVVGFLPGSARLIDGEASFEVTTHDLHSWPELYFDDIGWVQFEPTPGRGELGDYADVSVDGVPAPGAEDAAAPGQSASPAPSAPADDAPDAGLLVGSESVALADQRSPVAWIALGILGVLLLSLAPALVRLGQRWRLRVRARDGSLSAIGAWTEVLRTAVDLRMPVVSTETPRETARTIGGSAPVTRLLDAVEREGYGATLTEPQGLEQQVGEARAAMFAAADGRTRTLATLYPASLWRRIQHPLAPED